SMVARPALCQERQGRVRKSGPCHALLFTGIPLFFLMPRRPPTSTLFSLHDALPICPRGCWPGVPVRSVLPVLPVLPARPARWARDRKSTRLNSSHVAISYAVFCLKKKKLDRLSCTILSTFCPESLLSWSCPPPGRSC